MKIYKQHIKDKHSGKIYYYDVPREIILKRKDNYLFGGNRIKALERDGFKCVLCGMTQEEHLLKYGRDITVDHIDGSGCNTLKKDKNNSLDNLRTLCLRCHSINEKNVDINKYLRGEEHWSHKVTSKQVLEIRKKASPHKCTYKDLSREYGITVSTIERIVNNRIWKCLLPNLLVSKEIK